MIQIQEYHWQALGTDISILFPTTEPISKNDFLEVQNRVEAFEQVFSRFRKNSDLSVFNETKHFLQNSHLFMVCNLAQSLYKQTKGAFNPLLSVKHLGYTESYKNPDFSFIGDYDSDFSQVALDEELQSGTLKENQIIDLGGIAKGWIVDQIVIFLKSQSYQNFLVNAGGDIFAAGRVADNEPWCIAIDGNFQSVELENQAIATSGKNRRHWVNPEGKIFHHILNSETKRSAENELQAISVVSSSCAQSDAWATAAFALGKVEGQNLLLQNGKSYFLCL